VAAVDTAALRCSDQARTLAADPAGTAGHARAVLLVELPLPWPADVGDHAAVAGGVADVAAEVGARVQAIVPDPARAARGEALVVLHRADGGEGADGTDGAGSAGGAPGLRGFRRYERHAVVARAADLAAGARAAVASGTAAPGRDVLVCGHGSRDRCCGSLGTALHAAAAVRPDVHLHRTSHLGGHRFAPTALVLPEGTTWAWLDDALLGAIVDRRVPPAALRAHYRGSLAMPHPAAQVVEGEVFAAVGWGWLDHDRRAAVAEAGPDAWTVRIDSTAGSWVGTVERTGSAPQPVCGRPLTAATKADDHLRITGLDEAR
jgi:hypothetical protein